MKTAISILAFLLATPFIAVRLTFLAPRRTGFINYYSNVLSEFAVKRLYLPRWVAEVTLFSAGVALSFISVPGGPNVPLIMVGCAVALELFIRHQERLILD